MRSRRERIVHTALFEILAIGVVTPAVSMLTRTSMVDAGILSLFVSIGAVVSNYSWTRLFDRLYPTRRRTLWVRFLQSAGLEVIIACYTVPLTLWFTGISLWAALALDLAGSGFFVVFTMIYNMAFDAVMLRLAARQVRSHVFSR